MDSFTCQPNNSTVTKRITDILQRCCSANVLKIYSAVGLHMSYNSSFNAFFLTFEYFASFEHCYFKWKGELKSSLLMLHEQDSKYNILVADGFRDKMINQQHLEICNS